MEKVFKGLAAAVFRDNAWNKLVKLNMPPSRIDLPSAPHSSYFRGPELAFVERTMEGEEAYDRFQMTADISTFREWREQVRLRKEIGGDLPVVATFRVLVGGTKGSPSQSIVMNSKAFKGAASAVAQGNNWKSLIQLSLAPGQVVLKTASGHLNTKETALPFTKHSVENGRAYHHFQIAANRDNAPPRYNEWRMLHMARFKVKADGSKKDVLNALKDMEGDSMCDGTWAGDFRGASSMKIWIEWKIGRPEKSKTFRS